MFVPKFLKSLTPLIGVIISIILLFEMVPPISLHAADDGSSDGSDIIHYIDNQERIPVIPVPPQRTTINALAESCSILISASEKISLQIPAGAVSGQVQINMDEYIPWGSTGTRFVNVVDLTARIEATDTIVNKFDKQLLITIKHTPEELHGLDLDSLKLCYLDEKELIWVPVESSKFDKKTGILTAYLNHFSHYGELANPLISGPGMVMDSQVGLQSGASIYSYSIDTPAGPGGFKPKIELIYNSGSVDEMKNKRSLGSWVGIGWSLSLGRITHEPIADKYFLEFNNGSYELVTGDGINYYTKPQEFLKITRSGDIWEVYDKNGYYYEFGGSTGSTAVQYLTSADGGSYRWDLSIIRDTNGNEATVSYIQDIKGTSPDTWVRSAYPEYLTYGDIVIHFISSYDQNDATDGYIRLDNPKSYGSNPAPKVMENRKLDAIEVSIGATLIRKYSFAYTVTAASYNSSQYGGIYYSGTIKLNSIIQKGADGVSSLPATTFTYTNKQVYRRTYETTYSGNPGNAASLSWPFLTQVNSGYGGYVAFTYVQTPANTTYDTWTRECVATKTVNSGIGVSQVTNYVYSGGPYYSGYGWDAPFRGFSSVREIPETNRFINHNFYTTGSILAEKLTGLEFSYNYCKYNGAFNEEYPESVSSDFESGALDEIVLRMGGVLSNTISSLNNPNAVAIGQDGYIYVADTNANLIRKYNPNGILMSSFGNSLNQPQGLAFTYDGYLLVSNTNANTIQKYTIDGTFVSNLITGLTRPQGITVAKGGNIYVANTGANNVKIYTATGSLVNTILYWNMGTQSLNQPQGVAVTNDNILFVADTGNNRIHIYSTVNSPTVSFASFNTYKFNGVDTAFNGPQGLFYSQTGYLYVADTGNNLVHEYIPGTGMTDIPEWVSNIGSGLNQPQSVAVAPNGYIYVTDTGDNEIHKYEYTIRTWIIRLVKYTIGYSGTGGSNHYNQERYEYDSYGNVIKKYLDGNPNAIGDESYIEYDYYPNSTDNIVGLVARERTFDKDSNQITETRYYYDGNNTDYTTPPTQGNLTRKESFIDGSSSISNYYTYDTFGNVLTEQDPNGNITSWEYETTYNTYPTVKTYPITGLSESYTFDPGTDNLLTKTDVNGQTTTCYFDTFKRITKVVKPGDTETLPSIEYQYNNWGTINQQHLKTITRINSTTTIWQSQYFDGIGRVVQVQSQGETGRTIIEQTTKYDIWGRTSQVYVPQDYASTSINGYKAPETAWKSVSYIYDILGRLITQINADATTVSYDRATVSLQVLVTNERGYKHRYYYDSYLRLTKVVEYDANNAIYATTEYTYDTLGNLTQVKDNSNNITSISYDWLNRKTGMMDPDMGSWVYGYDNNGNIISQTDALSHTISYAYDALNRLTSKTYPAGLGMTDVSYNYDSTANGNYGLGLRTSMTDAVGTIVWTYDSWGRNIEELRTIDSVDYATSYIYDGLNRITTITYPTGEVVTNTYNGRGLPYALSGSTTGNLVTSTLYNQLAQPKEINFGNTLRTTFGYYGLGGSYDTTGGYYGNLWEIKTLPQSGGNVLQDTRYTWDAGDNVSTRQDVLSSQTETFTYDFLGRLTAVSGAYIASYSYNQIGNIVAMNGSSYTYSTQPHAVTQVGTTNYLYDANGNMTNRGTQTLTWDLENRPVSITEGGDITTFIYDGDGNRIKQITSIETILYINKFYEKNLATDEVTTRYYFGDTMMAERQGTTLRYVHQDSINSTSLVTSNTGTALGSTKYYPYGVTRSGSVPVDEQFTGQKLDGTGLYYYNARYYDPTLGRFLSADIYIQDFTNPQCLNRYSYCQNNPLKYTDPSGHFAWFLPIIGAAIGAVAGAVKTVVDCAIHPEKAFSTKELIANVVGGAVAGALAFTGIGILADITAEVSTAFVVVANLAVSEVSNVVDSVIESAMTGEDYTINDLTTDVISGALTGPAGVGIAPSLNKIITNKEVVAGVITSGFQIFTNTIRSIFGLTNNVNSGKSKRNSDINSGLVFYGTSRPSVQLL